MLNKISHLTTPQRLPKDVTVFRRLRDEGIFTKNKWVLQTIEHLPAVAVELHTLGIYKDLLSSWLLRPH